MFPENQKPIIKTFKKKLITRRRLTTVNLNWLISKQAKYFETKNEHQASDMPAGSKNVKIGSFSKQGGNGTMGLMS